MDSSMEKRLQISSGNNKASLNESTIQFNDCFAENLSQKNPPNGNKASKGGFHGFPSTNAFKSMRVVADDAPASTPGQAWTHCCGTSPVAGSDSEYGKSLVSDIKGVKPAMS